jgi:hypothetical protein
MNTRGVVLGITCLDVHSLNFVAAVSTMQPSVQPGTTTARSFSTPTSDIEPSTGPMALSGQRPYARPGATYLLLLLVRDFQYYRG